MGQISKLDTGALMTDYIPRVVDTEIVDALDSAGALVLRGTRAVGKTESARRVAASELRLDTTEPRAMLAREQPATALEGPPPRLIDEWQLVPALWNEVRHAVDDRREFGQFILSGSTMPDDDALRHSGAGRFRQVRMRTMSLFESGESTGAVSVKALLEGRAPDLTESAASFEDVVTRLVTGGWPGWVGSAASVARARSLDYVEDIASHDFTQVAGSRRDPRRFTAYLRALAALVAQPAPYASITRRMREQADASVGESAVPVLHDLAERMYLIEDQPAWAPQLRSRTAAVQTPKRHLADPSLVTALLGASPERLLMERETLGFVFESQVVHDLRIYSQAAEARGVYHYRDAKGRDEIDVIIESADGAWIGVEVKLGTGSIDTAAAHLHRVTKKMVRPPVAKLVVVPVGLAHRRTDGIHVVPLTVLGP